MTTPKPPARKTSSASAQAATALKPAKTATVTKTGKIPEEAPRRARTAKPRSSDSGANALESAVQGSLRVSPELRHHMIRDAAYYRAERRGFNGGDEARDWLEAEAEIDHMLGMPSEPAQSLS